MVLIVTSSCLISCRSPEISPCSQQVRWCSFWRVWVMLRRIMAWSTSPQESLTQWTNSSSVTLVSPSSCSSLASSSVKTPSRMSIRSSAFPCCARAWAMVVSSSSRCISPIEAVPSKSQSTILKRCWSIRLFSARFDLFLVSISFWRSRSRSVMFNSMKMAGTKDINAMDAKKMKATKKKSIPGLSAAMRSTVWTHPSSVMSLNIVHMETPRQEKSPATRRSSTSQSALVATIAETITTRSTRARSFMVAFVATARTTSSSFRNRSARKSRRMRRTLKRRPAEAPEPPVECPVSWLTASRTLVEVMTKSKRFHAMSSSIMKKPLQPRELRRRTSSSTYMKVKKNSSVLK
mmetsp:Transcript_46649/g.137837  ORF Transcript_46649/g.137837 Transcript_46649/m.137837 type:complete len:349 (+) Transcript_46649:682-1728(+)